MHDLEFGVACDPNPIQCETGRYYLMDERNLGIVLDALAEKIKDLELTIKLKEYEIENLKKQLEVCRGKN
jgi:hypothetical protein